MKKLSRSKLELFTECPRCFWFDQVKGIKRPPPAPYTINSAIDYLLKQEFDVYREAKKPHPIMEKYGVNAIPFAHQKLNEWRHNFTGVTHNHKPTGIHIFGAVDDIWVDPEGRVMVVDYKATGANQHQIYDSYGRQMEIYQWLLRRNDLEVSPKGYFVFARVNKGKGFSAKDGFYSGGDSGLLPFDIFVESYEGDDSWVEKTIMDAKDMLERSEPPPAAKDCEYCKYREAGQETVEIKKAVSKRPRLAGLGI